MDKELRKKILSGIERSIDHATSKYQLEKHLSDAVRHSLFPAGKRIRPLFSLAICHDLGGNVLNHFDSVVALELIHTSSLIHDDLPCLDNDDFRRGRPSCHKAHGEATALLAGDALIAVSFNLIVDLPLDAKNKILLTRSLSQAYLSLCNGQQLDILTDDERTTLEEIHIQKTGALFATSFEFGAICADVDPEIVTLSKELGKSVGVVFQILDDFNDIYGDPITLGRPVGSDERNNKKTFFNGQSKEDSARVVKKIIEKLNLQFEEFKTKINDQVIGNRGARATEGLMSSILSPLLDQ